MEAAFRTIPVAIAQQWLLGFSWEGQFYKEKCLPFGLRTAPFLFNLFAEGLEWCLKSWLSWELCRHLLDDIIHMVPNKESHLLKEKARDYIRLTNTLGIPRNNDKDVEGQIVTVLVPFK